VRIPDALVGAPITCGTPVGSDVEGAKDVAFNQAAGPLSVKFVAAAIGASATWFLTSVKPVGR
jgi:hypothetical protein